MFGDGSGAFTAWDGMSGRFRDENLGAFKHEKGTLSMANYGPDTNSERLLVSEGARRGQLPGGGRPKATAAEGQVDALLIMGCLVESGDKSVL